MQRPMLEMCLVLLLLVAGIASYAFGLNLLFLALIAGGIVLYGAHLRGVLLRRALPDEHLSESLTPPFSRLRPLGYAFLLVWLAWLMAFPRLADLRDAIWMILFLAGGILIGITGLALVLSRRIQDWGAILDVFSRD